MCLSIVSILCLVVAAQLSWAGGRIPFRGRTSPEMITILGQAFHIGPCLPRGLLQSPKESLTRSQSLAWIDQLLHARVDRCDSALKVPTDRHLELLPKTMGEARRLSRRVQA